MWEAIKLLKCARLDHGVRAMEDPACIAFLAETQVPLTVCPRSNYMVGSPPHTKLNLEHSSHHPGNLGAHQHVRLQLYPPIAPASARSSRLSTSS